MVENKKGQKRENFKQKEIPKTDYQSKVIERIKPTPPQENLTSIPQTTIPQNKLEHPEGEIPYFRSTKKLENVKKE